MGEAFLDANDATPTLGEKVSAGWSGAAWMALDHCAPADAAFICASYLAAIETGGPPLSELFGVTVADARFWADIAPVQDLVAYGGAALAKLAEANLGIKTRKQLFAALWDGFSTQDRKSFLSRVDPGGNLVRGNA